jgi:hypothetical protein
MQCLFLRLVLTGVSLRGAARVLAILAEALGWMTPIPHWTTGRLWLLRLGHAMLTGLKEQATDWAWLLDHSVQIGQDKCLVILGIRLCDLPEPGQCLTHADMELLAVIPRKSWTGAQVKDDLEATIKVTGVPRVIVGDHGGDVSSGVALFQECHPETADIYDAKHKMACLLKGRLHNDPRWLDFQRQMGQTRRAIQQTELAFLVPPGAKQKARYMNLEAELRWAGNVLEVLRQPPPNVQACVSPERLQEKLGWLKAFEADVAEWAEWHQVADVTVRFVNAQGLKVGVGEELRAELPQPLVHSSSAALAEELVVFVAEQADRAKPGERFPGSTEVLESCFGRFKQLEKQQARGGFTGLLLGFGAMVAETTTQTIKEAMEQSGTKKVFEWCKENLGTTMFGQRKLAFQAGATKIG